MHFSPDLASSGPVDRTISQGGVNFWQPGSGLNVRRQEINSERAVIHLDELEIRPEIAQTKGQDKGSSSTTDTFLGPKAAHDLLSALCAIASVSDWIADEYNDGLGPDGSELLTLLQKSVERMRTVIDDLAGCSRPDRNEVLP